MTLRGRHDEDANAEILGVVILIGIFAVTAGIISATVLATPEAEKVPAASIEITQPSPDALRIVHLGGDPLPLDRIAVRGMKSDGVKVPKEGLETLRVWLNLDGTVLSNGFNEVVNATDWVSAVLVWKGTGGESILSSWSQSSIYGPLGPAGLAGDTSDLVENPPRTQPTITPLPLVWSPGDEVIANFLPLDNTTIPAGDPLGFEDRSTGYITAWSWNFGDGHTLETTVPGVIFDHTFEHQGDYYVTLTVSNNTTGAHDTVKHTVHVTPPGQPSPLDFTISPRDSGNHELTVTCLASLDPDHPLTITAWQWDALDAQTGTLKQYGPYYGDVFHHPDLTSIDLKFENHDGLTNNICTIMLTGWSPYLEYPITVTKTVTVGPELRARFTPNATSAIAGYPISFLDESTGVVDTWHWDFGDGSTNETQHPEHVYANPGEYTVTLTVTGYDETIPGDHIVTDQATATIHVEEPVIAAFTSNLTSGEAPLTVAFVDQSTGGPTNWTWSFGDNTISHEQSPVHTYATDGKFKVSLAAEKYDPDSYSVEVKEIYIWVGSPVIADFTADVRNGPAPLEVHFTDTSTSTSADPITIWEWDFDNDGTVDSTEQNPSYIYTSAGTYSVSLRVENSNRFDTETKGAFVTVYENVTASFTADRTIGLYPLTVRFTDTSSGNPTFWRWDFGDGYISMERDPVHVFNGTGTYTVTLKASHSFDSDEITKVNYIEVVDKPIEARFSAVQTAGPHSLTVAFTDTSDGDPEEWYWEFGDGQNSTEQNPVHTYSSKGTYPVILTTKIDGTEYVSKPVTITVYDPIEARMSVFNREGPVPLAVSFRDISTGDRDRRLWNFGDNSTSTELNPTHTYVAGGTYNATLTVWNSLRPDLTYEASTTVTAFDVANASFTANVTSGVAPLAVQFTDTSTRHPTWRIWDFDNDGSIDSTEQAPTHVFTRGGVYLVSLRIGNPAGEDLTPATMTIVVSEVLRASFRANVTGGDAPLAVAFTDESTGDDILSRTWDFGDGGHSSERNPVYVYGTPGTYTVGLTVTNATGSDSETKDDYITVTVPPPSLKAEFTANTTLGGTPLDVAFTDLSTGDPTGWIWDFNNDGKVDSIDPNPVCLFEWAGTYTVNLTVTKDDRSDSEVKTGYIQVYDPPVADFSGTPTTVSRNQPVQFTDLSTNSPTAWAWDFNNDGLSESTVQNPSHSYSVKGTYAVRLSVSNAGGSDTLTRDSYITVK